MTEVLVIMYYSSLEVVVVLASAESFIDFYTSVIFQSSPTVVVTPAG